MSEPLGRVQRLYGYNKGDRVRWSIYEVETTIDAENGWVKRQPDYVGELVNVQPYEKKPCPHEFSAIVPSTQKGDELYLWCKNCEEKFKFGMMDD